MELLKPRCMAVTHRRSRCRRLATSVILDSGFHWCCELHWEHQPVGWWDEEGRPSELLHLEIDRIRRSAYRASTGTMQ